MMLLNPLDNFSNVRLLRVRLEHLTERWAATAVSSAFWRLWSFDEPGARVRIADRDVPLSPECLYLIPAWTVYDRELQRPCRSAYIHFDLVGVTVGQTGGLIPEIFSLPIQASFAGVWQRWRESVNTGRGEGLEGCCFSKALVLTALGEAFCLLPREKLSQLEKKQVIDARCRRILDDIHQDVAAVLTNDSLARKHGISPETLIQLFKKQVGTTPAQYVLEQRLKAAAKLLAFSHETLESIAEKTGFADRYHLSKVFRKRMGLPPARYRKMSEHM